DVGMLREAITELEKAVGLCPDFVDLRTRLGVLLRDQGDSLRAREQFEIAKAANPNYVHARVMLGVLLLSAHEPAEALHEFDAVLSLDSENKSAQMYQRLARTALDKLKSSPPGELPPSA
ncbi:MAG TPA: tetratricopeptide repeat protein, partial [Polyangiaceae bacterium]|nr:tetratricopeptide repeat protein [Polyangiaceae bacterium]